LKQTKEKEIELELAKVLEDKDKLKTELESLNVYYEMTQKYK
jgi:hypothetical protein